MKNQSSVGSLGNWISSWVQESGAIHGFHNHSVWGGNPYRLQDFTAGHSTWASPFLAGIALAISKAKDQKGEELLEKLVQFQASSFQENGQYKHVGFQVGETLQSGLIHNAIANISLGLTAYYGRDFLSDQSKELIKQGIIRNVSGTHGWGSGHPSVDGCCNQEYARIWSKLIFQKTFHDSRFEQTILEDLDFMISNFHVAGFPDEESVATYRNICFSEVNVIEPAEYYGLMISPLVEAYEQYGETRFLDAARGLCRHVVRSSWVDKYNQRRFHKMWYNTGTDWVKIEEPMLIGGMGITLLGISKYLSCRDDKELEDFLISCERTYEHYQTKRGFLVSATGWSAEPDIAPSTAWQSHDFLYMVSRLETLSTAFWEAFHKERPEISLLLGENCFWVENQTHWAIKDYYSNGIYGVLGKKSKDKFGVDMGWIPGNRSLDPEFTFPNAPVCVKMKDRVDVILNSSESVLVDTLLDIPNNTIKK